MPKAEKTEHCKSCPAFKDDGRCLGLGSTTSHIVFLGGGPKAEVSQYDYRSFADNVGSFFQGRLEDLQKKEPAFKHLRYYLAHASQCIQEKETAEAVEHCRQIVHKQIVFSGAKTVVALGASACKSLGITGSISEVRGKIFDVLVGGHAMKVIPTFNPGALLRKENTGLLHTFNQDLRKALGVALGTYQTTSIKDMTADYRFAKTVAEAKVILREILDFYAEAKAAGRPTLLAVDSETTGVKTYAPDFRVIALSFSWMKGRSAALLLNHREMKDDWQELLPELRELLGSDIPKALHNFGFDFKAIELALGVEIKSVGWDSMFAEYLLDENKQGLYGLKQIVKARVPEFTDYEKKIKSQLSTDGDVEIKIAAGRLKAKELTATKKELVAQKKLAPDRAAKSAVQAKVDDVQKEARSLKAELATLREKAARAKLDVALKTYEDLDVDDLLLYAAIDTDCTRRITVLQYAEMEDEDPDLIAVMRELMLPAARTLGRMEHEGIRVDLEYLTYLEGEFQKIADQTKDEVFRMIGHEINLNSSADIIKVFTQKYGMSLTKKTKKGKIAVDKGVLDELGKTNDIAKKVLRYRKSVKAKDTFLKGIRDGCMVDGRIHGSYSLTGTATGRLCVAKGTLVEVVRDVSLFPKGVPIEDVKVGDYAYCYDDSLNLALKKVVWRGKTGHKKVLRIHWMGQGRKHVGYLDVTPEHKVRLSDGSYVEAKDLKRNESLLALGRSHTLGYARLHTRDKEMRDHRFIFEQVYGHLPEHVHHEDGNKLNNSLSNLEGVSAAEHTAHHAKILANRPGRREAMSAFTKKLWAEGRMTIRYGKDASNYVDTERFQLLRELARAGGRPTKCKSVVRDFNTFKKKCQEHGINIAEVAKRYNAKNEFLSRGRTKKALALKDPETYKSCGVGYYRFQEICQYYGLYRKKFSANLGEEIYNHIVTRVEELADAVDVYDLEVEDHHNFIANEICVHNSSSSPNLQNVPARGLLGYNVKKLFIPDTPDEVFVNMDYSGAEIRVLTAYAHDEDLIKTLNEGLNIHSFVASQIFDVPYEEIEARGTLKESDPARYLYLDQCRQTAKTTVFLTIYGGGAQTLQAGLVKSQPKITLEECEGIINSFLDRFPIIRNYMETIKRQVDRNCFVKSRFGRKRRFPLAKVDWQLRNASHREGINFPVQSTSSDLVLSQLVEMDGLREVSGLKPRVTVHDSIGFSIAKDRVGEVREFLDRYAQARVAEKFPWLPVPFEYEAEYGPSYGECKTVIKK